MSAPPVWKHDGCYINIQVRDYVTGDFYWRRANEGDFSVILDAAVDAERKACAKIASDRAAICQAAYDAGDKTEVHPLNEALHIAQLIRNRER